MLETQSFLDAIQSRLDSNGELDIAELEYGLRTALFSDATGIVEQLLNQPKVQDSIFLLKEHFTSIEPVRYMVCLENLN